MLVDTPGVGGKVEDRNMEWKNKIVEEAKSCIGIIFIIPGGRFDGGVSISISKIEIYFSLILFY